jgi:general secretion pathway protein C
MLIKRLFLLVDLLFIALAVYLGVKGAYAFLASRLDTLPLATVTQNTATTQKKEQVPAFSSFRSIAQRNLFHTAADSEKSGSEIVLENLEETDLKLKLWCTVAGEPEVSYAIIEDLKTRKQNVYTVNDTVQNATLKMIRADKVVLSVSGKDEILELEKRSASSTSASTKSSTSIASASTSVGTSTATTTSTRRISLSRAQVEGAMENLTELMGQINIQPYSEDGVEGLALSNIQPNSIFRRMGLRNGDVLTAVDGQALTSPDQAFKLYEDLKSSDTANLEINRKGRSTNYQYRIR